MAKKTAVPADDERRTIAELIARYEVEPTLRDVYVEGDFDVALISWFLREHRCDGVVVYTIGTVNVPADQVISAGLEDGEKGRVIFTCHQLAAALGESRQVTGIVDRDYDSVLGVALECPLLLFTDYACMEMYCFNAAVLERFFRLYVRKEEYTAAKFTAAAREVLREGFLMRATNQQLGLALSWLEMAGQCDVDVAKVALDSDNFVYKYLNKGSKTGMIKDFKAQLAAFRAAVGTADDRHCINGHDFVALLAKYIHNAVSNKHLADPDAVERQVVAHLDFSALAEELLFKRLLERVRHVSPD
jgi:Protein of unknown function (DUF4435)